MPDSTPGADGKRSSQGPRGLHPALVRNTGFLISRMGRVTQKRFAQRMQSIGLTPRMWGLLNVLDAEGPTTQNQLGLCIGMDPSTMVSSIDELESKGFVERRRHPTDRRAYALHLTAEGRQTLTRGRQLARQAQEELLGALSREEREQLHSLLLRLALAVPEEGPRELESSRGRSPAISRGRRSASS